MRHWRPRIREAVAQMDADGIKQVIAIVMAPHSSRLSTGAYFTRLGETAAELGSKFDIARVESWFDHPGLIAALAEKVTSAMQLFTPAEPYVLFTAHSLPARILEQGDPTTRSCGRAPGCWPSAWVASGSMGILLPKRRAGPREPWLGRPSEQQVVELIQSGHKNLLVVPVGFVCDHVEVLYDIDIAARNLAATNGARLERSESMNASPALIATLADLVNIAITTPKQ
jgi:ferrochelatase